MIITQKGKTLLQLSSLIGAGLLTTNLRAETLDPTPLQGGCSYHDCAIFHECTDYHDQQNLAELNRKGIVVAAQLAPIAIGCHSYVCSDPGLRVKDAQTLKCERSAKLAKLVLAARDIAE